MKDKLEQELQEISRRAFLLGGVKAAAGVAIAGVATGLFEPQIAFGEVKPKEKFEYAFKEAKNTQGHPLPYQRLDPDKAMERAYKGYKEKGG